jgi:hypothetical protein
MSRDIRTITWYNADGNVVSIQNCAVGLEDVSQPEGATAWVEGSPQQIRGARVVDDVIIDGTIEEVSLAEQVRLVRNARLLQSDWTQAVDSPLSDTKKAEWATYRQALRDMPTSVGEATTIEEVVFPSVPE